MKKLLVTIALACSVGCTTRDPEFCGNFPNDPRCSGTDGGVDTGGPCTSNAQCSGDLAVCDLAGGHCAQCVAGVDTTACGAEAPVCDTDACRACESHADCPSDACLPTGACGDDTTVAYVSHDGSDDGDAMCTMGMPCATITKALSTARAYIKVSGMIDDRVVIQNQSVTLLADPDGMLMSTSNGVLLELRGASHVTVYDLQITGAEGTAVGYGVSIPTGSTSTLALHRATVNACEAAGISATGGTITIDATQVLHNFGGGILITGASFTVTNSFFLDNGTGAAPAGGIGINAIGTGAHVIDFNSFSGNTIAGSAAAGINCANTLTTPMKFSNNILWMNGGTSTIQVGGSSACTTSYSDIGPTTSSGDHDFNADPLFTATDDLHITLGSPAIGAADPTASNATDIDGNPRPAGHADVGADQYVGP